MKKAKEAAEYANSNQTTAEDIKKMMPQYKHGLHKNQWVANFFKHLNPDLHENFSTLQKTR